jgi:hypothetical protein
MMDRMTSMIGFADYFPALGNLMGGPGNTLWVQQPRSAAELTEMASTLETQDLGSPKWDVYDKDGKLLGDVTMPDNFVAMRWIGDRLAGVYTDANGVPSLKILRVSGL